MTATPVAPANGSALPRMEDSKLLLGLTPVTMITTVLAVILFIAGLAASSTVVLGLAAISTALGFAFYDADETLDAALAEQQM